MSEKRVMLEAEHERLEQLLEDLDGDWDRVRYVAVLFLLAIPAYLYWGVIGSSLTILTVVSLLATSYYLIGVRRAEYKGEMEELRLGIEHLERTGDTR